MIILKLLPSDGEKYKLPYGSSPEIIALRLPPIPVSQISKYKVPICILIRFSKTLFSKGNHPFPF